MLNNILKQLGFNREYENLITNETRCFTKTSKGETTKYIYNPRSKLILGAYYAIAIPPVRQSIRRRHYKISPKIITSDDTSIFVNATKTPYVLELTLKYIYYTPNYTSIIFTVTPADAKYEMPEMYIDVYGVHINGVRGASTVHEEYFAEPFYATTVMDIDRYIITDNYNDIKSITSYTVSFDPDTVCAANDTAKEVDSTEPTEQVKEEEPKITEVIIDGAANEATAESDDSTEPTEQVKEEEPKITEVIIDGQTTDTPASPKSEEKSTETATESKAT